MPMGATRNPRGCLIRKLSLSGTNKNKNRKERWTTATSQQGKAQPLKRSYHPIWYHKREITHTYVRNGGSKWLFEWTSRRCQLERQKCRHTVQQRLLSNPNSLHREWTSWWTKWAGGLDRDVPFEWIPKSLIKSMSIGIQIVMDWNSFLQTCIPSWCKRYPVKWYALRFKVFKNRIIQF